MTMSPETADFVASVVDDVKDLAALPEVTSRIIAVVNDPRSTPHDLYKIISNDPSLMSRVLKLVNSSFFSRATKIDSVERAIVLLGFDAIHSLAVAATMGKIFRNTKICDEFTAKDLWVHSIAVAVTARELGLRIDRSLGDEAFLAGLMHDVGILVALQAYPVKLKQVCLTAKTDMRNFTEIERTLIGVDHQQLGAELARRWGFPSVCQVVAGTHHNPEDAPDAVRRVAYLVYVADVLCCQCGIGFNLTARHEALDVDAISPYVSPKVIEDFLPKLKDVVTPALAMFQ